MNIKNELYTEIDNQIASLSIPLINGACKDIEHYRRITGEISGLQRAKEIMKEVVKKSNSDFEDDDG